MTKIKDFIGITVGASLLGPVFGAVGNSFTGALAGFGRATNTLISGGFVGTVYSKTKKGFTKFL